MLALSYSEWNLGTLIMTYKSWHVQSFITIFVHLWMLFPPFHDKKNRTPRWLKFQGANFRWKWIGNFSVVHFTSGYYHLPLVSAYGIVSDNSGRSEELSCSPLWLHGFGWDDPGASGGVRLISSDAHKEYYCHELHVWYSVQLFLSTLGGGLLREFCLLPACPEEGLQTDMFSVTNFSLLIPCFSPRDAGSEVRCQDQISPPDSYKFTRISNVLIIDVIMCLDLRCPFCLAGFWVSVGSAESCCMVIQLCSAVP